MKITQCHISDSLTHFREGFMKRWNLEPYSDPDAPCLFVGVYNAANDLLRINKHRGFKLLLFGGADIPNVLRLNFAENNIKIAVDEFTYKYALSKYYKGHIKKFIRIPFKDYSDFKPVPLGEKIYCYQSSDSPGNRVKYRYDIIEKLIDYFGKDAILLGYHGHSMEEMVNDFYRESFVNLQLNPIAGFTTAIEMAKMGRLSISNYDAPFCLSYSDDINDLISLIEGLKIGRWRAEFPEGFLHEDTDWLNTEFWL